MGGGLVVVIGKLKGTMAQNFAFMAPFEEGCYEKAEALFLRAKREFERPDHILRQNTYLAHLYIDSNRREELMRIWQELEQHPDVHLFLEHPSPQTAQYMQFVLTLQLKIALFYLSGNQEYVNSLLQTYTSKNLTAWFPDAVDEHPFEFTFSYLAQLAEKLDKQGLAEKNWKTALKIPSRGKRKVQVTLEAIRAQILVRKAKNRIAAGSAGAAMDDIKKAVQLLTAIGRDYHYHPMLRIENDVTVDGWFKHGYEALRSIAAADENALRLCDEFLRYFTFNYW